MRFREAGDWPRMREVAGELLAQDPDCADYHEAMGTALRQLGEYSTGEKHLKRAIELDPEEAFNYLCLGWLYYQWDRHGPAGDYARSAIELDPDEASYWTLLGFCSLAQGSPKHAEECARKGMALAPESLEPRRLLALARSMFEGKERLSPDQKLAELEELRALAPEDESLIYQMGLVHLEDLKDYTLAETFFRSCLHAKPQDKDYQKALIKALRKKEWPLRVLWLLFLPCQLILNLINWSWEKKWPLIFMIFIFKYLVVVGAFFFVLFGFFCWPVAKAYEYFTIADIHRKMGKLALYQGPLARLHRSPFALRMLLFTILMLAFWVLTLAVLTGEATRELAASFLIGATVLTVVLLYGSGIYLSIRDFFRNKRLARKNRKMQTL